MAQHQENDAVTLSLPAGGVELKGDLVVPKGASGLILFAHGSGSSRKSVRNRWVAQELQNSGLATLLFDLLTPDEEARDAVSAHMRFDIPLLANRLGKVTDWMCSHGPVPDLALGYFGASTGAAAALIAAAWRPRLIGAVVSRGGRPDLATAVLPHVFSPTLLIVGGEDKRVLQLNREALQRIAGPKELSVVPGATHLFEEHGALEQVARLAAKWFVQHIEMQPRPGTAERV